MEVMTEEVIEPSVVYVCPTWKCNLKCKHCEISKRRSKETKYGAEVLYTLQKLKLSPSSLVVYFGGEPMINKFQFGTLLSSGLITSVSTNLLLLDKDCLRWLERTEPKVAIATSWNPDRFDERQYYKWLNNLETLVDKGFDTKVLITLTPSLFEMNMQEVINTLDDIEDTGCDKFLFEPYVGKKEYHEMADNWLCDFVDAYKGRMENCIVDKLKNWNCDCSNTWTIEPTGKLVKGCPQFGGVNIPNECLTCDNGHVCRPCVLQKTCSYPKKLAKKVGVL